MSNDDNAVADDDFLPTELRCAITLELMTNPQVAADGNTYEHAAIRQWLERQHRDSVPLSSPLTGEFMPHSRLVPNLAVKRLVNEWPQIVARLLAARAAASPPSTPAGDARQLRLLSAALNERDMSIVSLKAALARSQRETDAARSLVAESEREARVLKQRIAALEMQVGDMRTRASHVAKLIADVHAVTSDGKKTATAVHS
jgi:hypothetical protein